MSPPRKEMQANGTKEKNLPVIKDDYGYIVNPYVPKFISKTPWYAEKADNTGGSSTSKVLPTLRKAQKDRNKEECSYDEKHDRWNKYDEADWKPQEISKDSSAETEKEKEKETTIDPYSRTCSRNLRIREDVVKYLDKFNSAVAKTYDPKSRSLGIRERSRSQDRESHFAWDESRKNLATPSQSQNVDQKSYVPPPKREISKKDDRRYNY